VAGNATIIVDFVANLSKLQKAAGDVETQGKAASKGLDWKGVAKWASAAGGLAVAGKFIGGAVKDTVALAKATMALQRATGLDTKTASEWVGLLQERGIDTGAFTKSMVKMSGVMVQWKQHNFDAKNVLAELGVSMDDVRKGDTAAVLNQVSDALAKISNPAERAVAAQKLFGRNGQALLPILGKGSAALADNLGQFDKYGATLDGNVTKSVADMTKNQRELEAAQKGLGVTVGTTLLPVMVGLFSALDSILQVAAPLLKNQTAMQVVIAVLALAFVAYQAAVIISTVATLGLNAAMLPQILLWGGIVLAVIAVIAVIIILAKNWDKVSAVLKAAFAKIQAAAAAVWNWIKANWPLLLAILTGPIGIAVILIRRYWDQITGAARSAIGTIRTLWSSLAGFISGLVSSVGAALGRLADKFSGPADAARAAAASVKSWIAKIPGYIEDVVHAAGRAAGRVADAIKSPINAVISSFNGISFTIPGFSIGGQKVGPLSVPKVGVPPHRIDFPDLPHLARGGVLSSPTLFLGGEGGGREIVTPEKLLRDIVAEHGRGDTYQLNLTTRTADAADIAYGFRRLELLRTGR